MRFQVSEQAPYWLKATVLRRKGLKAPQLYKFESESLEGDETKVDAAAYEKA